MTDPTHITRPTDVNTLHKDHYTLENGYVTARTSNKSTAESIRLDDKSTVKVTYVAYAGIGSLESAAVWKIFRLTEIVSGLKTEYADGNSNYDNIWNDRVSLTYS